MHFKIVRNTVSLAGVAFATVGAVLFLTVFVADLFGMHANPYLSIVFFFLIPGVFLFGLALIPIGAWVERRRRQQGRPAAQWPRLDLNDPIQRRGVVIFAALTMANVVI